MCDPNTLDFFSDGKILFILWSSKELFEALTGGCWVPFPMGIVEDSEKIGQEIQNGGFHLLGAVLLQKAFLRAAWGKGSTR